MEINVVQLKLFNT